jgi:secreted PhoX family phosphatase
MSTLLTRRHVLMAGGHLAGGAALSIALHGTAWAASRPLRLGPLSSPDDNGLRLPQGFSSRIIARGGSAVSLASGEPGDYRWHLLPDGGATFPTADSGWIYVSNSEAPARAGGGASALRFASDGDVRAAYRILAGTNLNCAGGPTPWGTWLSCEETADGYVHECDPTGAEPAQVRPALGAFTHEAVAVDPEHRHLYLTEDKIDGCLYRFTSMSYPSLLSGTLEVAKVESLSNRVTWLPLTHADPPNAPFGQHQATRKQVADATRFKGGEGIWYHAGSIFFTTKHDNRVWALDTRTQLLRSVYASTSGVLRGVDNIVASSSGRLLVAEDGGDMQLVALDQQGNAAPLLQVTGQDGSEITGPAFNPTGDRLYFSSQRGPNERGEHFGITYEVSGPFVELLA